MTTYATIENDGSRIAQDAYIAAFESRAEAVAYLLSGFDPADWNHTSAVIEAGEFGDCWVKTHRAPGDDESYFAPFTRDQLYIAGPGHHPGGRAWWIEPREEVLVIARIDEIAA